MLAGGYGDREMKQLLSAGRVVCLNVLLTGLVDLLIVGALY